MRTRKWSLSLHVTFCRIDQFSSRLDTIKDDFKESRKKRGKIKKSHKNAADVKLVMTLYFSFLFSLTRIMMPYTPEYNIKWVLNVEIRFPASFETHSTEKKMVT